MARTSSGERPVVVTPLAPPSPPGRGRAGSPLARGVRRVSPAAVRSTGGGVGRTAVGASSAALPHVGTSGHRQRRVAPMRRTGAARSTRPSRSEPVGRDRCAASPRTDRRSVGGRRWPDDGSAAAARRRHRRTGLEQRLGQVRRSRRRQLGSASASGSTSAAAASASSAAGGRLRRERSAPLWRGRRTGSSSGPRAGVALVVEEWRCGPERGGSTAGSTATGGSRIGRPRRREASSATREASASSNANPTGHGVGQGLGRIELVAVGRAPRRSSAGSSIARERVLDDGRRQGDDGGHAAGRRRDQPHVHAEAGGEAADDDEAERARQGQADERRVGQELVGVGQLVRRHADALVGHRDDVAVGPGAVADDLDPGVGRREVGGVLHQLGQEVGEVERAAALDEHLVEGRGGRSGRSPRPRRWRPGPRRRAAPGGPGDGRARRRRAPAATRRCGASGWPCGRA